MGHDEHEMLIEYSEMTAFNFNSKEFHEVRRDYIKCRNVVSNLAWIFEGIVNRFKPAKNY